MKLNNVIAHQLNKEQHKKTATIMCRKSELNKSDSMVVDMVKYVRGVYTRNLGFSWGDFDESKTFPKGLKSLLSGSKSFIKFTTDMMEYLKETIKLV